MFKFFKKKTAAAKVTIHKVENRDLMEAIVAGAILVAYADGDASKEELTKLLDFCSLSFQEGCLSFAKAHRHIDTLSDVQLRNGLNRHINTAWLPYKEYLPTCFDELT